MITIDNLTIRLGGRPILEDASVAIPLGARVGLIGRNGAGKSTLMKALIGELEPDNGAIEMPRRARVGYVAQEAPSGPTTPFEAVLAGDAERAQLLEEAETCTDMERLGDVHERLLAIDAYAAPSRAAIILTGLGFDETMQAQPLDTFSGGWKMRVALGALLLSNPEILLLDEPSNHLDLEATLWLESFLKSYQGTLVVISHERDLLNNVVTAILHLQDGKLTLYPGAYDAFEKQRAERAAQLAAAKAAQDAQRARLEDYVARNSARASTAKQAQSRAKMLARMQPIAALMEDPSLSFDFPSPDEMKPPLITLDLAAVGYGEEPILRRLNLRIDPDDRIALLGRNGNGKTTLARLLAAQLAPMEGEMHAARKMRVGYFTQYQVEELSRDGTPLDHMTRAMEGASPGAVRAQLGRFGFSGHRANARIGTLSGGERARLALALITMFAPKAAPFTSPLYALAEGLFLGALSAFVEMQYPGIAFQAVGLTFCTLFAMLALYTTGVIRATPAFKRGIMAATFGIMMIYLLSWVLRMFSVEVPYIHGSGLVGIGFSLFVVVIAAMNLVLDFDLIEEGAKRGLPKYMEWFAAFGLLVTLVWLYIEILRLLSKLRQR